MMHDQTITLYNYHEPSGLWYTTVFEGVQLAAASASWPQQAAHLSLIHI